VSRGLILLLLAGAAFTSPAFQEASSAPAKPAAVPDAKDPGWPRIYTDGKATLAVHQPQVDDWKGFQVLEARMALEIPPEKGAKKLLAAVHWEAKTDANLDKRTVTFGEARVTGRQVKISTAAPPIMVSTTPAVLVMIDGQPLLGPIKDTDLTFMVNTNWDLFKDGKDGDYFLLNEKQWLTAESLEGPWKSASKLPKAMNSLPADENWAKVKKALPISKDNKSKPAPWVYISNKPSKLILLQGRPTLTPISGTSISEVTNTKSLLFYENNSKTYYYLTSGRWFRNQQLRGNWEFADMVPQEIYNIPPESPKHNTTYVYVSNSDSETVTTAQTAGYMGMAIGVGIGVAVWGTGYYYPPFYYWGPMYPYPVYWGYPYVSYGQRPGTIPQRGHTRGGARHTAPARQAWQPRSTTRGPAPGEAVIVTQTPIRDGDREWCPRATSGRAGLLLR
jgi:hypothetical protein